MALEHSIKVFGTEVFLHRRAVAIAFVVIYACATVAGLNWPKGFTVATTVLVDEKSIIQPLMQGAAVTTEAVDRARLAREIIYGHKIMAKLLADRDAADAPALSPEVMEREVNRLIGDTTITNVGRNLIRIEYRNQNPELAYARAKRLAELYIEESTAAKAAESQAAFEFIDKQAQEYHEKLTSAEEALKDFRSANLDSQPGTEGDVSTRLGALHTRIEEATRELQEAEIRKTSLERQLSGEAEAASAITREAQYRTRLAELQTQLEALRLSYHETYPDIVRLRHQIEDLNEAITNERQRREQAKAAGTVTIDEGIIHNPMYQQLRREVSQVQVQIDTLKSRIAQARRALHGEQDRGKRVQGSAARFAELTRDYQVNREIYQDLLRRRENARVSMNLDKENQGLTFKIQEPARLPISPSGFRFWHFILAGLVLGLGLPLGLIYGKLQLDPRIRMSTLITARTGLPVLATVPHLWRPAETRSALRELRVLSAALVGVLFVSLLLVVLRQTQVV